MGSSMLLNLEFCMVNAGRAIASMGKTGKALDGVAGGNVSLTPQKWTGLSRFFGKKCN